MHQPEHSDPAKNFFYLSKLGEGSFGTVIKAKRLSDNEFYAIKKIKIIGMKQKDKNNALKQINFLASIQSPNIINYKEAFFNEGTGQLCTVMQLATDGDLSGKIKQKKSKKQFFFEYEIWKIGRDILEGLLALHQRNILHRDIKPANIFFGKGIAKIGDLNVSTVLQNQLALTQTGTPYYASPQVWSNQPYGFQCDIWSFGCLLYEMCCLNQPFKGKDMSEIYSKIKKCKYEPIPCRYSANLKNVIAQCLIHKNRRIKLQSLIQIFDQNTAPKCEKSKQSIKSQQMILSNKKLQHFPVSKEQFEQILPRPQYQNAKTSTSIEDISPDKDDQNQFEEEIKEIKPSFLDKFLRVIPGMSKDKNKRQKIFSKQKSQKRSFIGIHKSVSEKEIALGYANNRVAGLQGRKYSHHLLKQAQARNNKQMRSFKEVINSLNCEKKDIKRFDKYAIDRLNLRRRKLRIAMNY